MIYVYSLGSMLILLGIAFAVIEKNKYTVGVFSFLSFLLILGTVLIVHGTAWGLIPFCLGGLLGIMGFKGPQSTEASPTKKVWLITFLGRQTTTVVDRLTLTLDWPFEIVGHIEIDLKKIDHDFMLKKPILCKDEAYVYGLVSVAMVPDDRDDPPGTLNGKTKGEKLADFINIDGINGGKILLDDILTAWLQEFGNDRDTEEMERQQVEISTALYHKIKNGELITHKEENDIDDTRGLGLRFPKFQVILKVADNVMDARNKILIEIAQKKSQSVDTLTMNKRIRSRMKLYRNGDTADQNVKGKTARDEVFEEVALSEGKLSISKVVNEKGLTVANVSAPQAGGTPP